MDKERDNGAVIIGGDFHGLGIARNLAAVGVPSVIVDSDFCIGRFSRFIKHCYRCPSATDVEAFVSGLERLAVDKNLSGWVLYPTTDEAVLAISHHRDRLARHYLVPTPQWQVLRYAHDKRLTHQLAERLALPTPKTFLPEAVDDLDNLPFDFPVILKPASKSRFFAATKKKAIRADDRDQLNRGYEHMASIVEPSQIMVQQLIEGGPDNLYSFCSLFSQGRVKGGLVARRARQHPMDFGNATTFAITCDVPQLADYATRFLQEMQYNGLSEIEFMYDRCDGQFKLLEMNARTWGWHTLGAAAGVNFSKLLFDDINGRDACLDSFEQDIKWVRLLTDIAIAFSQFTKRKLKITEYLRSLKGPKEFALWSRRDPLPFLVELLLAPYFWLKRGF